MSKHIETVQFREGENFFSPPIRCNISFMGMKFSHISVKKNVIRNISVVEYVNCYVVIFAFCFCLETVRIVDVHI